MYRRRRPLRVRRNPFQVAHFRDCRLIEIINVGTGVVNKAYNFKFDDVLDHPSFAALYDAYRINKIFIRINPLQTTTFAQAAGNYLPQIIDLVDYDDATALSTTNDYLSYGNKRIHSGDKAWTRKFTPAVRVAAYQSGGGGTEVNQSSIQKFKQWIDMAEGDIPHFGYKVQWSPINSGTPTTVLKYEVWCTMYFSCRMRR